jgi:hypothetical protein
MRILDKQKDYYDYHAGIFGIDNTVFFDRRGSIKLTQNILIRTMLYDHITEYNFERGHIKDLYGIIEVGYFQYLFRIFNITVTTIYNQNNIPIPIEPIVYEYDGQMELVYVFDDRKHYFLSPINLYAIKTYYHFDLDKIKKEKQQLNYSNDIIVVKESLIKNPIFIDTKVPSILDSKTVYINVFDYISSKADFDIVDTRDDIAKAVDHGFDKKTSFRRM